MDQRPYQFHSQSNFMKGIRYSNLFAFIAIMFLFTSCSFWGIPQKVLGEEINPINKPPHNDINPFNAFHRMASTQYTDTDIIMTNEEIQSVYNTITEDLEKRRVSNIEELTELHNRKLAIEEAYYDNLKKLIDKYYHHLMEKNNLAIDKQELEAKLKQINDQLYSEHVKLAETHAKQTEAINTKVSSSTNELNREKKLLNDQYEQSKKLIK